MYQNGGCCVNYQMTPQHHQNQCNGGCEPGRGGSNGANDYASGGLNHQAVGFPNRPKDTYGSSGQMMNSVSGFLGDPYPVASRFGGNNDGMNVGFNASCDARKGAPKGQSMTRGSHSGRFLDDFDDDGIQPTSASMRDRGSMQSAGYGAHAGGGCKGGYNNNANSHTSGVLGIHSARGGCDMMRNNVDDKNNFMGRSGAEQGMMPNFGNDRAGGRCSFNSRNDFDHARAQASNDHIGSDTTRYQNAYGGGCKGGYNNHANSQNSGVLGMHGARSGCGMMRNNVDDRNDFTGRSGGEQGMMSQFGYDRAGGHGSFNNRKFAYNNGCGSLGPDYGEAQSFGNPGDFGGQGSNYSELGANLKDIDWSQEELEAKGSTSLEYLANAQSRSQKEVEWWRMENQISVSGRDVANPIFSFEETGFPQYILDSFRRQGFQSPTSIQSQGWGPAMEGRDLVGVAETGSGKTIAFGIPGLLHIAAQPPLRQGDGPQMLVIAPTRELSQQIEAELRKVMPNNLRAVCCYGGAPKPQQEWELRKGVNVIIATPGRLIDFLESGVTNLRRVTYLVMDEADRMLDMGFEPDVRKIVGQIRPDRQTLLWSATWPKAVQKLARDFQNDIIQIQVGTDELKANTDITQHIILCSGLTQKLENLILTLQRLEQEGSRKAIVFAGTKRSAEDLCTQLREHRYLCAAIHGDKEQPAREKALWNLKTKPRFILVATDVAQRGLDVPNLPAVINFDFPDCLEDYIHRIGRTGRAGNKGQAVSFFTPAKDCGHARGLISILQQAGQMVPPGLERCCHMTPPARPVYGGKKNKDGTGGGSKAGFKGAKGGCKGNNAGCFANKGFGKGSMR